MTQKHIHHWEKVLVWILLSVLETETAIEMAGVTQSLEMSSAALVRKVNFKYKLVISFLNIYIPMKNEVSKKITKQNEVTLSISRSTTKTLT